MKRDRLRHAVHRKIAEDVATLRAGPLDAPALERDMGKFFYVEKLRAAQVVVAFFDPRINAAHIDLRTNRRIFRTLAVDIDPATEVAELAAGRAEKLMHAETDCRAGRIELVALFR